MKKILVWGTGSLALKLIPVIHLKYDVLGFVDNNKTGSFLSKKIYKPNEVKDIDYDLIVVCSSFFDEIEKQAEAMGLINIFFYKELENNFLFLIQEFENLNVAVKQITLEQILIKNLEQKHIKNCCLITDREQLLKKMDIGSIGAEIGVAAGDFTKQIFEIVNPKILHLVDIWDSDRYGEPLFNKVNDLIEGKRAKIHRKLSIDAAHDFEDNYFDWIYIDTVHTYEATYQELNSYKDKIKSNGYLMGHDYTMGSWSKSVKYGVIEAVHRFCVENDFELVYLTMNISEGQSFAIRPINYDN